MIGYPMQSVAMPINQNKKRILLVGGRTGMTDRLLGEASTTPSPPGKPRQARSCRCCRQSCADVGYHHEIETFSAIFVPARRAQMVL